MLLRIGRRETRGDPASLLLECHARIRDHARLAVTLGFTTEASAADTLAACHRVERYFREALPLHVADEEESLMPRLATAPDEVRTALAQMQAEHARHRPLLETLLEACARVRSDPHDTSAREALGQVARPLESIFLTHLEAEERTLLPAIEQHLSEEQRHSLLAEMRKRRTPP